MSDFDFQPYLSAIALHYAKDDRFYTPTDALLPLEVRAVERQEKADQEKRVEQFPVLEGLRRYALGEEREHVLLAGRPGSGKSTALRQLVVALAADGFVPVLVQLKADRTVPELINAEFRARAKVRVTDEQIEDWLLADRLVLLLDGVNEIPTEELLQQLQEFREAFPQTPMIFTTRDLSLGGDLGIGKRFKMKPLSERQMREFVGKRLGEKGEQLLGQLRDQWREIAETPLLLKMLCDVFEQTGKVPQNKGELFRRFDGEYERFKGLPAVSADFRRFKSEVLQHLAYIMMVGDGGVDFELTIDLGDAERTIEALLKGRVDAPGARAKEWLEDLVEHHWLQVAADGRRVEFHHQLFQEYYAAEWLLGRVRGMDDETLECEFLNLLKWTETVELLLGLVEDEGLAVRLVERALGVDLMLGASLAAYVKYNHQNQIIRNINTLKIPHWLKEKLPSIIDPVNKASILEGLSLEELVILSRNLRSDSSEKSYTVPQLSAGSEYIKSSYTVPQLSAGSEHIKSSEIEPKPSASEDINELNINESSRGNDSESNKNTLQLSSLINCLQSPEPLNRLNAAVAIGQLRDKEALPNLVEALADPNLDVQRKAIWALGQIHGVKAIPALLEIFSKSNDAMRESISEALLEIGGKDSILGVINALKSSYAHVRRKAVESLELIGNQEAASGLLIALEDSDIEIRSRVAEALSRIDLETVTLGLLALLEDTNKNVRLRTISALHGTSKTLHIPVLAEAIKNSNSKVREIAAYSLGMTGLEEVIPIISIALEDESLDVSMNAAIAAQEIGHPSLLTPLWLSSYSVNTESSGLLWHSTNVFLRAIQSIQSNCKFYNYEIHQKAQARAPDDRSPSPSSITYVQELHLMSTQPPIFNQQNATIGVNYAAENSNPKIIQNVQPAQQESPETALLAIIQIIQALEQRHTGITDRQQAIEIIDAEFKELKASQPRQWQNLLSVKRFYNGGKKAAVKLGEHFTEENPWGKGFVAFLEGFSEDLK
jgi:HEAT repeat protein/energy-coupling factor transporter ATP-binding protein EcfA2